MRYSAAFGTWQLDDLPGCSQVCVSHSAFVLPEKRNKGHGTEYHQQRLEQIRDLKYDYAVATVDALNVRQVKILKEAGWSELNTFTSSKTGHTVILFGRHMR